MNKLENFKSIEILNFLKDYEFILSKLVGGKEVSDNIYFHKLCFLFDKNCSNWIKEIENILESYYDFNVIRFSKNKREVALLFYKDYFDSPFPELLSSLLINISDEKCSFSDFTSQENPPILHRKELLIPEDHELRDIFEKLTTDLEDNGAYDQPAYTIGRRDNWNHILSELGISIIDHKVSVRQQDNFINILRHRTAISRSRLSSPVYSLLKWGFLEKDSIFFDYGCGRGDDIKILNKLGILADGWDPYFAPTNQVKNADIVNLGFVLNVIENLEERKIALERAFSVCSKVLSVAVMLTGRGTGAKIHDGVVTSRNTFQKYFSQNEIYEYIKRILKRDPIAVGPGIFFVFKSDFDEQDFLSKKQKSKGFSRDFLDTIFSFSNPYREQAKKISRPSFYEAHTIYLETFWDRTLSLGRFPEKDEFEYLRDISDNPKKLFQELPFLDKNSLFEKSQEIRKGDLLVFLSLNLFERRKSFSSLSPNIQRDIRYFFGNHNNAISVATKFLFSLSSGEKLVSIFKSSDDRNLGKLASDGDYTFHIEKLADQDPVVRVLIGCAEKLDSIPTDTSIIKIHTFDRRISFLIFDNFRDKPLPALIQRLRIDLKRQKVSADIFESGSEQRLFFGKSEFISSNFYRYQTQKNFDNKLFSLGIFRNFGLGGSSQNLDRKLKELGIRLNGYRVVNSNQKN